MKKVVKRWTDEEEQFLREKYGVLSAREIGEKLGRGTDSVKQHLSQLGIKLEKQRYTVYQGEDIIAEGTAEECAKKLDVTKRYIQWMATAEGHKRIWCYVDSENARIAFKHIRRQL